MIGIPNQTIESLNDSLDRVIDLGFNHISLYMLQLEQGTPFYKKYHKNLKLLPDEDIVS